MCWSLKVRYINWLWRKYFPSIHFYNKPLIKGCSSYRICRVLDKNRFVWLYMHPPFILIYGWPQFTSSWWRWDWCCFTLRWTIPTNWFSISTNENSMQRGPTQNWPYSRTSPQLVFHHDSLREKSQLKQILLLQFVCAISRKTSHFGAQFFTRIPHFDSLR